ncbi:MAG: AraD1 family protein [Cyclobacteriaceae bacterium]
MRIIQFINKTGLRKVGIVENERINILERIESTYQLFRDVIKVDKNIQEDIHELASSRYEDYSEIIEEKRILLPLDHPDPYHLWITGTGLTHLGSAASRNEMHKKIQSTGEMDLSDSLKMFRMGVENGKMNGSVPASQPEWFYKGNGLMTVHPERELPSPSFAYDGGEEAEIVGLYIIDSKGLAKRIGFALANEFSDHKMESINYLYLAHSKLRACSYGPELLLAELPRDIRGMSRILRDGKLLWEKEFLTGEDNMTHNLANLEYHHFKYELFQQPGDAHVHFFGASVLSYSDKVEVRDGDIFEIQSDVFGRPLRNRMSVTSNLELKTEYSPS